MLILAPVPCLDGDTFWSSVRGADLLGGFLSALCRGCGPGDSVLVGAGSPWVRDVARGLGMASVPIGPVEDGEPVPGLGATVRAALERGADPDGPVAVVCHEFPASAGEMLEAARKVLRDDPGSVHVSCREVEDHPCQGLFHYRLADVSVLYLRDGDPPGGVPLDLARAGWFVSRAFLGGQSMRSLGEDACGVPHVREVDDDGVRYLPATEDDRQGQSALWLPESGGHMRVAVPPSMAYRDALALGLDPVEARPAWLLLRREGGRLGLAREDGGSVPGPVLLRFSACRGKQGEEYMTDVPASGTDDSFSLPCGALDADALVFGLLEPVGQGGYDLTTPYPPVEGLWSGNIKCMRNERTGRSIKGRQDFPELLEVDGMVVAGPLAVLRHCSALLRSGEARPFRTAVRCRTRVVSEVTDLLACVEAGQDMAVDQCVR